MCGKISSSLFFAHQSGGVFMPYTPIVASESLTHSMYITILLMLCITPCGFILYLPPPFFLSPRFCIARVACTYTLISSLLFLFLYWIIRLGPTQDKSVITIKTQYCRQTGTPDDYEDALKFPQVFLIWKHQKRLCACVNAEHYSSSYKLKPSLCTNVQ